MKPVYVTKTTTETQSKPETITELKHFICALKEGKNEKEELEFKDIDTIAQNAFINAIGVKEATFQGNLKTIKKEAFKNCEDLEVFCCGEKNNEATSPITGIKITNLGTENSEFTIETSAFTKCKNLHTVILPDCKKLVIEKDAFDGCSSLRTVVCFAEEIDFTGNPFESCPETLTFVGKREGNKEENKKKNKTSELERFARENGYRFIDA